MYAHKIKSLKNARWHETDELILHGSFQALVDFVEKQKPSETINWDDMTFTPSGSAESINVETEFKRLYNWWKYERPKREKNFPKRPKYPQLRFEPHDKISMLDVLTNKYPKSWSYEQIAEARTIYENYLKAVGDFELKCTQEDQFNLHRLIDIRSWLWT